MSASLVGSEMCIRDRKAGRPGGWEAERLRGREAERLRGWKAGARPAPNVSVSYTHLTLPTICSV
eukprot:8154273-Alexandrium_andersonii.AAC.1